MTEPDLRSAEQAGEWLKLLRTTLRQLGVSDVNMEEGSLRCDANVSLRPAGRSELGHEDRAQEHELVPLHRAGHPREIARQSSDLEAAGQVVQETLHFDPASGAITVAALQGGGPRLPLLPRARSAARGDRPPRCSRRARSSMPELPGRPRRAASRELGLSAESAQLLAFRAELGDYFEAALAGGRQPAPPPRRSPTGSAASFGALDDGAIQPTHSWSPLRWPSSSGSWAPRASASGRANRCSTGSWPTAGTRRRSCDAEGLGCDRRGGRAGADRRRGARGQPRRRRAGTGGQREGDRADRRPRDARDQGPRRRRRGHALVNEQLASEPTRSCQAPPCEAARSIGSILDGGPKPSPGRRANMLLHEPAHPESSCWTSRAVPPAARGAGGRARPGIRGSGAIDWRASGGARARRQSISPRPDGQRAGSRWPHAQLAAIDISALGLPASRRRRRAAGQAAVPARPHNRRTA